MFVEVEELLSVCNDIYAVFREYYGDCIFLVLALISYIYLFVKDKELRIKWLYPVALIVFCVVNPVLYMLVFRNIIYWRLFWMFPDAIIIALAATRMIKLAKHIWVKLLVAAALCGIVLYSGNLSYTRDVYSKTENAFKLPATVAEVCDVILAGDDEASCIMPYSLYCYTRQYSGDIRQMYGRNIDGYIAGASRRDRTTAMYMIDAISDYNQVLCNARFDGCNYVVVEGAKPIDDRWLDYYGYELYSQVAGYNIYHLAEKKEDNEWIVSQYEYTTKTERSFYTIEDKNGQLVIIDGGNNASAVSNVISNYDNHVAAWILTTYDKSHIGAFNELMGSDADITVDNVYTVNVDFDELCDKYMDKENKVSFLKQTKMTFDKLGQVNYVSVGDTFTLDNLSFEVYNGWDGEENKNSIRDCSMVFGVKGNKEGILFCSDVTKKREQFITDNIGDEFSVYTLLQLGNHGHGSVTTRFYDRFENLNTAFIDVYLEKQTDEDNINIINDMYIYMGDRNIPMYRFDGRINTVIIR